MKKTTLSLLLLLLTIYSCEKSITDQSSEVIYDDLNYRITFPDTVLVNQIYSVTVEFESNFDSIIKPVQVNPHDSTKMRLITFYQYKPIECDLKSREDLILIDSTFIIDNKFTVDSISFDKKGKYNIIWLLKDEIMYSGYNEEGILNSVKFDERKQHISKKVTVID